VGPRVAAICRRPPRYGRSMNVDADGATSPVWWYSQPWSPATVTGWAGLIPSTTLGCVTVSPGSNENVMFGTGLSSGEPGCRMTMTLAVVWLTCQSDGYLTLTPPATAGAEGQSELTCSMGGATPSPSEESSEREPPLKYQTAPPSANTTARQAMPTATNGSGFWPPVPG
jgi:hypothetical protein